MFGIYTVAQELSGINATLGQILASLKGIELILQSQVEPAIDPSTIAELKEKTAQLKAAVQNAG